MTSKFTSRVLAALGETFRRRAGDLLEPVVEAYAETVVPTDELLEPVTGGWSRLYDLDQTPLPATLGAATGTPIPSGLTITEQRTYLRDQPRRRRGSAASITAAARLAAPGRRVDLFERQGSPWNLEVRLTGGAADPDVIAAVEEAVQRQKPTGITLDVTVTAGATVAHVAAEHGPTVADLAAEFPTVADLATHVPEGGTIP